MSPGPGPYPANFPPPNEMIYDVVLAAHDACINAVKPGVEYQGYSSVSRQGH
jgi:Xaa-Pro aminopeptidase